MKYYLLKNYYGLNEIMINWTLNKVEKRYVLDYISNSLSFTYNSTHPACILFSLYPGAEHPSINSQDAFSSTIIKVCSN